MKYINPYYPWFTYISSTVYASGSKDGYFSTNSRSVASVRLDEDSGTHMKMGLDMKFSFLYAWINLVGFTYHIDEDGLTHAVYVRLDENYFCIEADGKIVFRTDFKLQAVNVWHRIFFDVDTVKGIILLYADGKKIGEYTEFTQTGVSVFEFNILTDYDAIVCKNIIVTDGQLSPNETVIELTASVDSNEWDVTTEGYATDNVGKNIVLKPGKTKIDGYKITAASMVLENAISSDSVSAITASMCGKSEKIQLPSGNSSTVWACFDEVDSLDNIVVTSAE